MHFVEVEGIKPRKSGRYWSEQVKGVGKLHFTDQQGMLDGSNVVTQVRILRVPGIMSS